MKTSSFRIAMIFMLCIQVYVWSNGQGEEAAASKNLANFNATGYPIVDEKITVEVMLRKDIRNGDFTKMQPVIELEELTNIHLDLEVCSPVTWKETKNLRLASGDLPDVFMGSNTGGEETITRSDQVKYGPQGYFIPLEGLIEKYGVNTKRVFQERPEYRAGTTAPDGHIYSLASVHELKYRENPENLFINKKWLDKLGLEIPRTTDEFYQVLKAFKKGDPNGNGVADEIPLSFLTNHSNLDFFALFGSWGVIDRPDHIMIKDAKALFSPVQEGYKQGILYFRKLYAEGLIDGEVFTHNMLQYRAKGKNKDAALFGACLAFLDEGIVGNPRANNEYQVIPPLSGPSGEAPVWRRKDFYLDKGSFVITSANENPEATFRWADACLDDERSLVLARGAFGKNLKKNADGSIEFLPEPEGMSYADFRNKNTPGDAFPWVVLSHWYDKIKLPPSQEKKMRVAYPLYEPYLEKELFPFMYFLPEQEERLSILATDINSYVDKKRAQWIVGEADIEEEWDDYMSRLDTMGLDELTAIFQSAYDSYLSALK